MYFAAADIPLVIFFLFPIGSMFKTAASMTGWMSCYNFRHGETPSMDQTQAFIQMCARFINQKPLEVIGEIHNLMSDPLISILR